MPWSSASQVALFLDQTVTNPSSSPHVWFLRFGPFIRLIGGYSLERWYLHKIPPIPPFAFNATALRCAISCISGMGMGRTHVMLSLTCGLEMPGTHWRDFLQLSLNINNTRFAP